MFFCLYSIFGRMRIVKGGGHAIHLMDGLVPSTNINTRSIEGKMFIETKTMCASCDSIAAVHSVIIGIGYWTACLMAVQRIAAIVDVRTCREEEEVGERIRMDAEWILRVDQSRRCGPWRSLRIRLLLLRSLEEDCDEEAGRWCCLDVSIIVTIWENS